ncbi:ureidoglycolate lyase [Vineibacter terrae]|uniref:ureidoglycolate lyase n=1 Tax=Vineibacter terrae TaxID=2586908 RepID=UPI002E2EB418|nr:ureidoglycolate lyase [Vineibacter terrae]HEX2887855.1 ureidoglycolate lyase [Vineibacter terrae]
MPLIVRALTPEAFAPYGDVLTAPADAGRQYFEAGLGNLRPGAHASLSMVNRAPIDGLPLEVTLLERHEFSSQTFVPTDASRWLIIVCPHAPGGGPDAAQAIAFVASGGQGVTYRPNTWHHGLTVLDRPASFAVFMWRDGTQGDEEFVTVEPFTVAAPG